MNKILLADDHAFIRRGLIQILRDDFPTVEVMEVGDGISLIKEVSLYDWDLVITDIDMPGVNGLEALEKIKSIKPKIPVLVLSIHPEEVYAVRVLKAGASGYLNKCAAPEELITAIERIALGKKYISPQIAESLIAYSDNAVQPYEKLTNKEFSILKLLAAGKPICQIAATLNFTLNTVSTYRFRILHKLNLANNVDLVRYAISHHIISDID